MEKQIITKIDLEQFTGTENFYRYHGILLTDGSHYLAEKAKCFWLIDLIESHSVEKRWLGQEDFIVCKLSVQDSVGEVVFDDGNGNVLARQNIPFTDFPLDEVKLYLVAAERNFVLMLPSEY